MTDDVQDLNSRIDRIEVTLSHAVEAIEKMAQVVNKPTETKWGPILAALTLLFLAASGYTTLITIPMNERSQHIEDQILILHADALQQERDIGRLEGRLERE